MFIANDIDTFYKTILVAIVIILFEIFDSILARTSGQVVLFVRFCLKKKWSVRLQLTISRELNRLYLWFIVHRIAYQITLMDEELEWQSETWQKIRPKQIECMIYLIKKNTNTSSQKYANIQLFIISKTPNNTNMLLISNSINQK